MIAAIRNHARTDPDAPKHQAIGRLAFEVGFWTALCAVTTLVSFTVHGVVHAPVVVLVGAAIVAACAAIGSLCSLLAGVGIELVQRWKRRDGFNFFGPKQNSVKESMLDIGVTWHWYIK